MNFFEKKPLYYASGPRPYFSLLWLHGLGADGHDFEGFVEALSGVTTKDLRFVFPHAPLRPVSLDGGVVRPAWFDLFGTLTNDPQDEVGIERAAAAITELIEAEGRHGVPAQRVFLGGFSQGGALALYTALTGRFALAGAAGLSTYLPLAQRFAQKAFPRIHRTTPIFLAHGTEDPLIPYEFALKTRAHLTDIGVPVTWHSYGMPHTVSEQEIGDLRMFLSTLFADLALGGDEASG